MSNRGNVFRFRAGTGDAENTMCSGYKGQSLNAVYSNSLCFCEGHAEHIRVSALCRQNGVLVLNPTARVLTTRLQSSNGLKEAEHNGTMYVKQKRMG